MPRQEAEDLANYDQPLNIVGTDIDHRMIETAKGNAVEAGFGDIIEFKQMQVTDFTTKDEYGVLVGNPPYGERSVTGCKSRKCIRKWEKLLNHSIPGLSIF